MIRLVTCLFVSVITFFSFGLETTQAWSGKPSLPVKFDGKKLQSAIPQTWGQQEIGNSKLKSDLFKRASTSNGFIALPTGTISEDLHFESGKTYLVTGPTSLTGVVTFEGSSVVKFDDNGASLNVSNPVFETTSSNWIVFTSVHDNSVGELIPGSTGTPFNSVYTNALSLPNGGSLRYAQFRYASEAVIFSGTGNLEIRDSEFFGIGRPLRVSETTGPTETNLLNVLIAFSDVGPLFDDAGAQSLKVTARNLTTSNVSGRALDANLSHVESAITVSDSLFTDTGGDATLSGVPVSTENHNAFFNTPTVGTGTGDLSLTVNPILIDFFLEQASPVIDAGSQTAIEAGLYHYRTDSAGSIESATQVDIGYHSPPSITDFSIFATHGLWLKKGSSVQAGKIGVNQPTPIIADSDKDKDKDKDRDSENRFFKKHKASLVIGVRSTPPTSELFADSVRVKKGVDVLGPLHHNTLKKNKRSTIAQPVTPLALPIFDALPKFKSAVIGSDAQNILVRKRTDLTLSPGEYGDIRIKKFGRLTLTAGTYHIRSLRIGREGRVWFDGPAEVRIQENLEGGKDAFVGPKSGSGIEAHQIQFFVEGADDGDKPRAVKLGKDCGIEAHVYAPNGTVHLKKATSNTGVFLSKFFILGVGSAVNFNPTPPSVLTVSAPTISPDNGTFIDSATVTMATITSGASIFYTLDGSTPDVTSSLYTGPFAVTSVTPAPQTLKAIAIRSGFNNSSVTSATLNVIPRPTVEVVTIDPDPTTGPFTESVEVTLSSATAGAAIFYTLDGSEPTTASPVFANALTLTESTTLKAFATFPEYNNAPVTTALYEVDTTPPIPGSIPDAPSLDETLIADLSQNTAFLYTGSNAVQTGLVPGTIETVRAAVVRGQVFTREGNALSGVTVTVMDHPEFGQTLTRSDGFYDLAVNGGTQLVIDFNLNGFLPGQRSVKTESQDFSIAEDIALIQLDAQSTVVDLASITTPVLAQGSPVTDADGTRQAAVLFPQGITAEMVLPDGSTQPLNSMTVRATEYTVGDNGPMAMPAELPPASGYTYAVELSVDEALAAGADTVNFNQPIPAYVDNFLGFPAGIIVPSGYYDPKQGKWLASESGLVIDILSVTGGFADLDVDGSATAAGPTLLASLGISDDERQILASQYGTGSSLWRVPVTHFTTYDWNWARGLAINVVPKEPAAVRNEDLDVCNECPNRSVVQVQAQILGESIPLAGTPFSLNYATDRTPGYRANSTLTIPVTGDTVPASIINTRVTLDVMGRSFVIEEAPAPNLLVPFTWDGLDAYGRRVPGEVKAHIKIEYEFQAEYQVTSNFGDVGGATLLVKTRTSFQPAKEYTVNLKSANLSAYGLGSWTLDAQHFYEPFSKTLYLGDGPRRSPQSINGIINTVAGGGTQGTKVDGMDAVDANFNNFLRGGMVFDSGGDFYFMHPVGGVTRTCIVYKVTAQGKLFEHTRVTPCTALHMDIDAEDNIYAARHHRRGSNIIKIDPSGGFSDVTKFIDINGNGFGGDGGPASEAKVNKPLDVAVDSLGNIYIADENNGRIRKIDVNGIIDTLALASGPVSVAVDFEDNLYYTDNSQILKVDSFGTLTTFAGNGTNVFVEGALATESGMSKPWHITADRVGNIHFAGGANFSQIRKINASGIISTFAGSGSLSGFNGDGIAAINANLIALGMAIDSEGAVYFVDQNSGRIRRISPALPGFSTTETIIVSEDGSELYSFDSTGRHLRTVNTLTGAPIYDFAYDAGGLLSTVTDGDSNVTTVQRDIDGNPTAIVSAEGQVTLLTLDGNGFLNTITNPKSETNRFEYTNLGLMVKRTDPRQNDSIYTYNDEGRLASDSDSAGGSLSLARSGDNGTYTVDASTALGRVSSFKVENFASGGNLRTVTDPNGLVNTTLLGLDNSQLITSPDGTVTSISKNPDPRWGMQAPLSDLTVTTPGGRVSILSTTRSVTLADPDDLFSLTSMTDTLTLNGRAFSSVYDAVALKFTDTTPEGRITTSFTDVQGRITKEQVTGLEDTDFTYDARGRLTNVRQATGANERLSAIAYNLNGFVQSVTDPLNRAVSFEYDLAGRVTKQVLPDLREINFTYDANGNVSSITPPGRPSHAFQYTAVDLESEYTPPDIGLVDHRTRFLYNVDKQLTSITRPDATTVAFNYEPGGRVDNFVIPRGTISFSYDPVTGNVVTITAPDTGVQSFTYDGSLLLSSTWAGTVNGNVARTYDIDFRITTRSVNGGNTIGFTYDNDSLLTGAGSEALAYDPTNGLLTGTTLGVVADSYGYSSFAEVASYSADANAASVFSTTFTRDKLGRITQKIETVQGVAHTFDYFYDFSGRLIAVTRDGVSSETFTYDQNGNRTNNAAVYDDQDRLTNNNLASYSYSDNGELLSKTAGSDVTSYNYDVLGNLMSVTLPSGSLIEYIVDGSNRRIGKKVDGTLAQGFIYKDQVNPVAELDGSGNVVSRFVYASRANVPDYLIKGGNTYRIISDHLGSPRLVIDTATGLAAQVLDYDAFGNIITDTNPGFQPFGFAGGLYDESTKLTRFGARDYDAELGRWTSKDPIRFSGGDTNLYGYVLQDPVNFIDPDGLVTGPAGAAIGFVAGAIGGSLTGGATGAVFGAIAGTITGAIFAGASEAAGAAAGAAGQAAITAGIGFITNSVGQILSNINNLGRKAATFDPFSAAGSALGGGASSVLLRGASSLGQFGDAFAKGAIGGLSALFGRDFGKSFTPCGEPANAL